MSDLSVLIVIVYNIFAIADVLLLAVVIRLAMNDLHLNRTDPPGITLERRKSFAVGAYFLLFTGFFQEHWLIHPTTIGVGLLAIGFIVTSAYILSVSMVSMRMRAPPDGKVMQISSVRIGRRRGVL